MLLDEWVFTYRSIWGMNINSPQVFHAPTGTLWVYSFWLPWWPTKHSSWLIRWYFDNAAPSSKLLLGMRWIPVKLGDFHSNPLNSQRLQYHMWRQFLYPSVLVVLVFASASGNYMELFHLFHHPPTNYWIFLFQCLHPGFIFLSGGWSQNLLRFIRKFISGWWFGTFFIFHNTWDNPSHWLIFFKMVKTTNQITSLCLYLLYPGSMVPLEFDESSPHHPPWWRGMFHMSVDIKN